MILQWLIILLKADYNRPTIIYSNFQNQVMIKGIIFDMDNTIINSLHLYYQSYSQTISPKKLTEKFWYSTAIQWGMRDLVIHTKKKLKLSGSTDTILNQWRSNHRTLIKNDGLIFIKGFKAFNRKINQAKFKKIIATGSDRHLAKLELKEAGLQNQFKIIDCHNLKYCKPKPDIFKEAHRLLKLKPQECIIVEDSFAGIKAAKLSGSKVIALTTTHTRSQLKKLNPDLIIKDYTQLTITQIRNL